MIKILFKLKIIDYVNNPIGSFKLEAFFWLSIVALYSYSSAIISIMLRPSNVVIENIPFMTIMVLLTLVWIRISNIYTKYIDNQNKNNNLFKTHLNYPDMNIGDF